MSADSQVREWVSGLVSKSQPGQQLPTDKEVATTLGLSAITVRRTMRTLAGEGVVVRARGRGTFVPGGRQPAPGGVVRPGDTGAQAVVAEILRSIGSGELKRGDMLPSYKVLCANLHLSPNTVRAAYRDLQEQGLVTKSGKYYHVGRFIDIARTPSRRDVVLFAGEGLDISMLFSTHEAALAFNKMERELAAHGLTLAFDRFGNMAGRVSAWLREGSFPYGLLLAGSNAQGVLDHTEYEKVRLPLERLLHEAGEMRPRVVALTTVYQAAGRHVTWFSISHAVTVMRRKLAWFLAEKGIPRAAYFHEETAGSTFLIMDALRMVPEMDHLRPGYPLRFVVKPRDSDLSRERFFSRFYSAYPRGHLEPRLSKYRPIALEDVEPQFTLTNDFAESFAASEGPCAWIFEQERCAVQALDWCSAHGIAVPRQVSIIGLENRREFADRGITACVRDWETMGYLMAHALVGDIPLQKTHRGFVAYDALLLERRTT